MPGLRFTTSGTPYMAAQDVGWYSQAINRYNDCIASACQVNREPLAAAREHMVVSAACWNTGTHALWDFPTWTPETQLAYQAEQAERNRKLKEADTRAYQLLAEMLGKEEAQRIDAGGAYEIRSTRWPGVSYLVPRDPYTRIKILAGGVQQGESCLVVKDFGLPWADQMLQRIKMIQADETVVYGIGVCEMEMGRGPGRPGVFTIDEVGTWPLPIITPSLWKRVQKHLKRFS